MGPAAGNGAELQFAFTPFQASELLRHNLLLQILGGLQERGGQGIVPGLSVQARPVNPLPRVAGVAAGLGVQARSRNLQPDLDTKGRFGLPLVFEHDFGGRDGGQAMQVLELLLHLTVPGVLGVEAEVAKSGFHRR